MAWVSIRKATTTDHEALERRAAAFVPRHNLKRLWPDQPAVRVIDIALTYPSADGHNQRRLDRLWTRVVRRALAEPQATGIAHGHIGYWVST